MNKEQEQGLFNQIEEVLQTHEELYELGAWEEFDADRKRKKRRWPVYAWTAAAVILLCLGFGLFEIANKNKLQDDSKLVKSGKKQEENTEIATKRPSVIEYHQPSQTNSIAAISKWISVKVKKDNLSLTVQHLNDEQITSVNDGIAPAHPNTISENAATTTPIVASDRFILPKQDRYTQVLPGAYDSLANRNRKDEILTKHSNKLSYSLVVSPSLSNQKVNFAAGMELSYKVGNGFSVNGGLMYTALNAKSDGKSLVATNSKPQSANLAVSGVELPLGIQYQTSGGFYASAGVSALGLIKDKLEYDFLEEKTVTQNQANSGLASDVYVVVSERKTEESVQSLNNYMGFFNFSAGKKQAFGNLKLNIGPFVKVPFSSVSSEKIKLLQGGIKVSVDF